MEHQKIAWIGAGKMGLPICKRLKAAGHDVAVLARRPDQSAALTDKGFAVSGNVADLIHDADIVFTAVSDDQALGLTTVSSPPLQRPQFSST
jgi:3-hydroxyisobutyrate dehydrogenase-like beta-hydroxyacid dehydrogenase